MSQNQKGFNLNLKYYHIMILSIILSLLLIINSNNAKNKRINEKLDKEADSKFNKILIGRHLETFEEDMEKICSKGSEELKDYFLTGSLNKLGIDFDKKEENEETPEYIHNLIDIINSAKDNGSDDIMDNAIEYSKHLKTVAIFVAFAVLSIPGWIFCCSCCCCNCCCCCCCKKGCCKLPFFIITTLLYVLVAIVCIYGLSKSNSIFKGLADIECSILRFCNEVKNGETKDEKPKWIGIEGIDNLLDEVKKKIEDLGTTTLDSLKTQKENIAQKKENFEQLLEDNSGEIINKDQNYITIPNEDSGSFHYRLDITTKRMFGEFDASTRTADPEQSFVGAWFKQYDETAKNSEKYIGEATEKFTSILEGTTITENIDDLKKTVNEIGDSINDIEDGIADSIVEFSDYIDEYGKSGFKIFFSVLIAFDALVAILMFLFCFFSGKLCNNCCLCRCIFKCAIHLFWNILALLMFVTFLIAFLFCFIGTIGSDLVYVLNYYISPENFNKDEPELFGKEGEKLGTCFNEDGDILKALDFNMDEMASFDDLKNINNDIEANGKDFEKLKNEPGVYGEITRELNDRKTLAKPDFSIISEDVSPNPPNYVFSSLMNELNREVSPAEWKVSCEGSQTECHKINEENICLVYSAGNPYAIGEKIESIKDLVKNANGEEVEGRPIFTHNFKALIEKLNEKYQEFLDEELGVLGIFDNTIKDLTGIFDEYIGEGGGVFDFVNCHFIGKNIQVILNNLEKCLGGDLYTVSIWLFLAGCSLAISISFTILLIVIINSSVDDNKKAV